MAAVGGKLWVAAVEDSCGRRALSNRFSPSHEQESFSGTDPGRCCVGR